MANGDERVFVGTVGEGLYISNDGGETFKRPSNNGLYIEGEVRALASHPDTPARIFAGTHAGVCRSTDGGDTWQRMASPSLPGGRSSCPNLGGFVLIAACSRRFLTSHHENRPM